MADAVLTLTEAALAAASSAEQAAQAQLREKAQEVVDAAGAADTARLVAAVPEWQQALQQVAESVGTSPGDLLVSVLDLPPIPGLPSGLAPLLEAGAETLSGGWRPEGAVGPAAVGVDLDAVTARAGPAAFVLGLLPPSGARLRLGAGAIQGAGGLSISKQPHPRYAGSLTVGAGPLTATAAAVLEEPPGKPLALVLVLTARLTPGIQVGFGFEIGTIGGLVAINRRVDPDAIRAHLASGEALAALFPGDPAASARSLPGALVAMFPPQSGGVVAGPALEVTWLQIAGFSLVRLSLAALLELPAGRVIVLGRGMLSLPPVIHVRVDVAGEIDAARGLVAIDAALVDSEVFGVFRVAGTGALRVQTGGRPYAVVTVGGFFPGYRVEAPGLPPQRRISFTPIFPLPLSVRAEGYLAVTDGTFQVGGSLEVGMDVGILAAHGHVSVDAIAQLDPFHFRAELSAGFDVEALGLDFCGVEFRGSLDGPGPLVLAGRLEVSFLGAKAGWNDRIVLSAATAPPLKPAPRLADLLAATVSPANLRASGGADPHVAIHPSASPLPPGVPERPLASPLGTVAWSQTTAPLHFTIAKAANRNLAEPQSAHVTPTLGTLVGTPREWFSPAALLAVDRNLLLSLPAFDQFDSGVEVRFEPLDGPPALALPVEFVEAYRTDAHEWRDGDGLGGAGLSALLQLVISGRWADAAVTRTAPAIRVASEQWAFRVPGSVPSVQVSPNRSTAVVEAHAPTDVVVVALPIAEPAVRPFSLAGV